MKPKPTVGQTLYSLNVRNAARNRLQTLTPVKVTSVGRKYFKVAPVGYTYETEYQLHDWSENTEYCKDSELYASEQEWEDEKECKAHKDTLREVFSWSGARPAFTLDQLRRIMAIVNEK